MSKPIGRGAPSCCASRSSNKKPAAGIKPEAAPAGARQAEGRDLPSLLALCVQARQALVGKRGGELLLASGSELSAPSLQVILDAEDHLLVAGTEGTAIQGVALVCEQLLGQDGPQKIASVSLFYVAPAFRRRGIGRAMLALIEQWSLTRGHKGIDLPSLPGDRATKAFSERTGYLARMLLMYREHATE